MADNINEEVDNNDEFDGVHIVDTKIVRLSNNPKEMLFSITFDDYKDLPSAKGDDVFSSEFSCFGCQWSLNICPGGDIDSLHDMVGVYLQSCSEGRNMKIKYSLGFTKGDTRFTRQIVNTFGYSHGQICGWKDFCLQTDIIGEKKGDSCFLERNGTLTIHVGMQLDEFIPKNPASPFMLKLFDDENSADIVFEICEEPKSESQRSGRKRTKTSTAKLYHAHRFILQHYSQELSDLCTTSDGMSPIIITDVKPEVFRHLLYYVYGGEISYEDFEGLEKELISAADKYGVTNLKLEAEVWYVNNEEITIDNVIDKLLYADAKNCALLKESVMDFIVENKETVMQQERLSFQDVPGDVIKELLAAVSRHDKEKSSSSHDGNETGGEKSFSHMRISDLREKLHDKGLDIDGSREALIAKLKEHS